MLYTKTQANLGSDILWYNARVKLEVCCVAAGVLSSPLHDPFPVLTLALLCWWLDFSNEGLLHKAWLAGQL